MRPAPEAERNAGIQWYVTDGPPCPARAKAAPEDFEVEELVSIAGTTAVPRGDYFPLYRVEKRSLDTMHMAKELSEALRSRVSYAGLKDKRAVTVQYVTPTSKRAARPSKVSGQRFKASLVGYVPSPLTRSSLVGNSFSILLRDSCGAAEARVTEAMEAALGGRIPNYYGLQRFGAPGPGTHRVGRAMARGEFQEAVTLMLAPEGRQDAEEVGDALEAGSFEGLAGKIPRGRDVERAVARELERHPGDWVKALRGAPVKLRRLYVQAYQSFIFNRTMSLAVEEGAEISKLASGDNWAEIAPDGLTTSRPRGVRDPPTNAAVPLVQLAGYAFRDYGSRFDALVKRVMESEGVEPKVFFIREMQEASQEGGFRRPQLVVRGPSWSAKEGTVTMKFTLPKGQYATVLLREIVKAEDPADAGLA